MHRRVEELDGMDRRARPSSSREWEREERITAGGRTS
jgi:hypothetical protein